ncbi:DJ-1 family glyoxalase III [Sulfurimonas sp. HSL-1716]|uniref:DJ-1 family glyoxalase III n=1 Tax=Hydrocurvibacter sulfurireducens TaxID=3131937 RepID=UPI0031FA37FC
MATVLVPLAAGFEEIEAVSIIDTVRRSSIEVIVASVDGNADVQGGHGITVKTDTSIKNISADDIDMIVLPGGWGGTKILAEDLKVQSLLKEMDQKGKQIGAICAAPFALGKAGVLKEKFTCYPSVEADIDHKGYDATKKVVSDKNILTSRGPGTAICFGLEIIKILLGDDAKEKAKGGLLADYCE